MAKESFIFQKFYNMDNILLTSSCKDPENHVLNFYVSDENSPIQIDSSDATVSIKQNLDQTAFRNLMMTSTLIPVNIVDITGLYVTVEIQVSILDDFDESKVCDLPQHLVVSELTLPGTLFVVRLCCEGISLVCRYIDRNTNVSAHMSVLQGDANLFTIQGLLYIIISIINIRFKT